MDNFPKGQFVMETEILPTHPPALFDTAEIP